MCEHGWLVVWSQWGKKVKIKVKVKVKVKVKGAAGW